MSTIKPMNFTPRQRIQMALRHQQPDRVPFSWGLHPTPEMSAVMENYLYERGMSWRQLFTAVEDSVRITANYIGPILPADTDLWGIIRKPVSYGIGVYNEISKYPLAHASTVAEIGAYPWPNPDWFDYRSMHNQLERVDPEGRLAGKLWIDICGNPFELYTWMTGHERTFLNLVERPEIVWAAMEQITRYFEARLYSSLPLVADRVDLCYFADDLGGQKGLLISRRIYRQLIMPFHQRLFRLAKSLAPHASIMFHSDGSVFDILPDLIEAGVEVLEAVQVDAAKMDPVVLKKTYGVSLAFHGGISVQSLLPHSSAEAVEMECRRLVDIFGQGGGYIAAPTHCIQVGTPPENVLAMLRGILGPDETLRLLDQARLQNFSKSFLVEKPHLFFPIKNGVREVLLQVQHDGQRKREFLAGLALNEAPDWWAYYDVSEFLGQTLSVQTLEPSIPQGTLDQIRDSINQGNGLFDAEDLYQERYRPQFHFTPRRGWNNDPNGLVYLNGTWHLFFQYNPFGITWGNMHWGHAVSRDLVHWQELPVAIYQLHLGDMAFSGGATLDALNTSGFKGIDTAEQLKDKSDPAPMIISYTSTGRGECLVYSLDSGETFCEYAGNPVIRHAGRDPKIIWYKPGQKWVMVVYEEIELERGYALYDSNDLKTWRRFDFLPGFFECPELFELTVVGTSDERYWVLYGALWEGEKSVFALGRFDGDKFTILQEPVKAHCGPHFYAAQTFSSLPEPPMDRRIMLGWLAGAAYPNMPFSQGMSLPLELSLERFPAGMQLCFSPVKELDALRINLQTGQNLDVGQANDLIAQASDELLDISIVVKLSEDQPVIIELGSHKLVYDPSTQEISFAGSQAHLPLGLTLDLRFMIDRSVVEVFARTSKSSDCSEDAPLGAVAFSAMTIFPPESPAMSIQKAGIINSLNLYRLKSIWELSDQTWNLNHEHC